MNIIRHEIHVPMKHLNTLYSCRYKIYSLLHLQNNLQYTRIQLQNNIKALM